MTKDEEFKADLAEDLAFLPKMALDFALLTARQAESVYERAGIDFPVSVSSTVLFLARVKTASLVEIARALGQPHQLIAQRIKILVKLDLIESEPDPEDGRRIVYSLTRSGKAQSVKLLKYCDEAAVVFAKLCKEIGADLLPALSAAVDALQEKPLLRRFQSLKNKKAA